VCPCDRDCWLAVLPSQVKGGKTNVKGPWKEFAAHQLGLADLADRRAQNGFMSGAGP
jgi:hypothetical protein